MRAVIKLSFTSSEIANRISYAIVPDNTPLPEGLEIDVETNGANLMITIISERGIDSFRGTIEDVMSSIDLSLRTMTTLR